MIIILRAFRPHRSLVALLVALLWLLHVAAVHAQGPLGAAFTYQGHLDAGGDAFTGSADFQFLLFDGPAGGAVQIGSTLAINGVNVVEGLFTTSLNFGPAVFAGDERWLEIRVTAPGNGGGGPFTTLSPRQRLDATPYALFALNTANPSPFVASGANAVFTGGNVGIGTASPSQPLHVANGLFATLLLDRIGGSQLSASAQGSAASIGTSNNFPFRLLTNNTVRMAVDTSGNVGIGIATPGARLDVRSSGTGNILDLYDGISTKVATVIDGGNVGLGTNAPTERLQVQGNVKILGWIGTDLTHAVDLHTAGQRALRLHAASTTLPPGVFGPVPNIIGGYSGNSVLTEVDNTPMLAGAVIGGGGFDGEPNRITDHFGFIGGGAGNFIGSDGGSPTNARFIVVAGGLNNLADDFAATIVGGENNRARNIWTFVGGGENNQATASRSAIVGGTGNLASGSASAIGGGEANVASGLYASVPGGQSNTASSLLAFAAGRRAKANHQGTFVWGDSTNADFASTANNQFLVRAGGGVGINTNAPAAMLHVAGDAIFNSGVRPGNTAQTMNITATSIAAPAAMTMQAGQNLTIEAASTLRLEGTSSVNVIGGATISLQASLVSISGLSTLGIGGSNGGFMLGVNGSAAKIGGGSWSTISDARLKTSIQPLHGSLEQLLALQGVSFRYRDPSMPLCDDREHTGFIAQQVERVFPQWVDDNGHGYKTLSIAGFEALTVEALRELRAEKDEEIRTLRAEKDAEIATLRHDVEHLTALVEQLLNKEN